MEFGTFLFPCGPSKTPNSIKTLMSLFDNENPNSIHTPVEPGERTLKIGAGSVDNAARPFHAAPVYLANKSEDDILNRINHL